VNPREILVATARQVCMQDRDRLPNPSAGLTTTDPRLTARLPSEPEPPTTPRRVVGGRARRWARMLEDGVYPTRAALARAEGVSRAAVTQALGRMRMG
jgi:hypothetical protein